MARSRHHRTLTLGQTALALQLALTTTSSPQTITPRFTSAEAMTIDWGDGSPVEVIPADTNANLSHTYATAGSYTIEFLEGFGALTHINVANSPFDFDISAVSGLTNLTELFLNISNVSGNISAVSSLTNLESLLLFSSDVSGNLSAVSGLTNLTDLRVYSTDVSGDLTPLTGLVNLGRYFGFSTNIGGTAGIGGMNAAFDARVQNCNLTQAEVDTVIADIYANRANFTNAAPNLRIDGDNAAPSGTFQAAATPTTGKEQIYALINDPNGEGFNTWTVTFTA